MIHIRQRDATVSRQNRFPEQIRRGDASAFSSSRAAANTSSSRRIVPVQAAGTRKKNLCGA